VRSKPPDPWWVKLSDFGISKRAADNLAASSTLKGTLRYMAPELLGFVESGEESDSRNVQAADMWALGEIAFQMLTKEPTFKYISLLSTYVRSPDSFPSAVLRAHDVSEAGINFINSIMQPKPEDRQTTAKALVQAWMEPYSSHTTGKTSSVSTEYVSPNIGTLIRN
jgi:serine/threonine protein kinase